MSNSTVTWDDVPEIPAQTQAVIDAFEALDDAGKADVLWYALPGKNDRQRAKMICSDISADNKLRTALKSRKPEKKLAEIGLMSGWNSSAVTRISVQLQDSERNVTMIKAIMNEGGESGKP